MTCRALAVALALLAPIAAHADDEAAKKEARALLQGGNKLREGGDLAGALALFESAYARYPSAKILINIGTTLRDLKREADAANVYARYLAAPDVGTDRVKEVQRILAELDRSLGQLTITIEPADAEVAIGGGPFVAAGLLPRWRVAPGVVTVRARKDGWEPSEATATVKKGKTAAVTVRLVKSAVVATAVIVPVVESGGGGSDGPVDTGPDAAVRTTVVPAPASRIGITARALVDGRGRGAAGAAGALVRVHDRVELQAAAIFARPGELTVGAYAAAHVELGDGAWRPRLVAGLPVIFDDGPRFSGRAAAGLAWFPSARFAVVIELGGEFALNPAADIDAWQLTPTIGAEAHL